MLFTTHFHKDNYFDNNNVYNVLKIEDEEDEDYDCGIDRKY